MKKETVIETISKLPDEFSIDEVIERLILIEKIDQGLEEVKAEKTNSEEETESKLGKWLR